MSQARDRMLFLKWLLLNALALVGFVALAALEHGRVHGASRVAIPIILLVFCWASAGAGRICWRASAPPGTASLKGYLLTGKTLKDTLLHDANWLGYWAYACQILGILSTVYGFWTLLAAGGSTADLGTRIQAGGGVALLGTFVGVLTSLVLTFEHRLIEHELA